FRVLKSISRGIVLQIAGGERWFSHIYVHDLVEGLLVIANTPDAAGRTYYLANPKTASWTDLGFAAARIMGRRPRVLRVPIPMARAVGWCSEIWSRITHQPGIVSREKVAEAQCRWWVCDPRRAHIELGFEARTPLDSGSASTLAWYKEAGWLAY